MNEKHVPSWWKPLKELYALVLPLRFNFFLLIVLAYALLITDQGHDIIAHIAEANGFGPGILFSTVTLALALQVWFWSRQLLHLDLPQEQRRTRPFTFLTIWLPRVLGFLVFLVVFGALVIVHHEAIVYGSVIPPYIVKLEILTASLAILFIAFTIVRRVMLREPATVKKEGLCDLSTAAKVLSGLTLLLYWVFFFASFWISLMNWLTSPFILMFSFALWVTFGFFLVWLGHRWQMPLMTLLLIGAVAISPLADNHDVRSVQSPSAGRKNVAGTFQLWMDRLAKSPGAKPNPVVFIVATEGGGIRAAYWTAAVLGRLHEATSGAFSNHLFAISGVSGGAVGSAVFATALVRQNSRVYDAATETLAYDALAPLLASMTSPDLLQRFIPFVVVRRDRATQLEMGWEEGWKTANASTPDALRQPLMSLYANGGEANYPSLFLNGTSIEGGGRLITSNCLIDLRNAGDTLSILGHDVRVSTASLNSARFPYVSPIGGLPGQHVADGGYFENSGSATAVQIANAIATTQAFKDYQPRIVFIVIDFRPKSRAPGEWRFGNELFGPPRALLATRGAHAIYALGELPNPRIEFTLLPTVPQPLGWMLADASRGAMDAQMKPDGPNRDKIKQISDLATQ